MARIFFVNDVASVNRGNIGMWLVHSSAICQFSFRFPVVFGGFWVSRNLETLKDLLNNNY
jgi:hypothetical protein